MTKPVLSVFLLLFSTQILADEICPSEVSLVLDVEENLLRIQDRLLKKLPELSAGKKGYLQANCKSKKLPDFSFDDMDGDDPRLVAALTQFTTHSGYCPSSANGCRPQLSEKAQQCSDAKCKLVTQFGKREAELMVYAHEKFRINASPMAFSPGYEDETFKNWSAEELEDVLLSLEDAPPQLTGFLSNQQLNRRSSRRSEFGTGTLADSRMTFNGLWAMQSREERRTSAFHEFGHTFSHHFNVSTTPAWMELTGWQKARVNGVERWVSRKPTAIVSQYGATSPEEDFAESVAAYRYNPKLLMSVSKEKYRFIKEVVFGGVEFTKKNKCKPFPPLAGDWQEGVKAKLVNWADHQK